MTLAYAWSQLTAIGPVILSVTPHHGIHLGDGLALIGLTIPLLILALCLLIGRERPARPRRASKRGTR